MSGLDRASIPTPAEFLFLAFRQDGYLVQAASFSKSKLGRITETLGMILAHHRKIDVLLLSVYVGQSFILEDLVSCLAQYFRIPTVMVLHNGLTPAFVSLFPGWTSRVFRRAVALVAPSPFLPRALKPYGWPVRIIPNPVDISAYPFRLRQQAAPSLLWMRSFYPYYNPHMALRVLRRLVAAYPQASLAMAGKDKGLQAELIETVAQWGIQAQVRFPGFLNGDAKIRTFQQTDIFINTNSVDNTPVSVVEAWAMGLPVISTNVGGIADLVEDGETGLLVRDDDDTAMAEAIQRLMQEPALAEKLSCQGRAQAEKFSWQAVRPQWQALFDEITSTHKGRP